MATLHPVSMAGFAATAVAFGPARMGFGLFVPQFRDDFALTSTAVGYVSSLGFLCFFAALLAAQAMLDRFGPAAPVTAGLSVAVAGLAIVAGATGVAPLVAGVCLAAGAAGFAWTPFNDAVHRSIADPDRPAALSIVSSGTTVGIAAAGALALAVAASGLGWRVAWIGFTATAAVALAFNVRALRPVGRSQREKQAGRWWLLAHRTAVPLYAVAFAFGLGSAVFLSFAADRFAGGGVAGMRTTLVPGALFVVFGLAGLAGLLTGQAKARLGLTLLLRLLMAAGAVSLALAAVWPDAAAAMAASAALQGISMMMLSAALAFWAERLFPELPSLGFTAALLCCAAGSVLGPALVGLLTDAVSGATALLSAAAAPLAVAVGLNRQGVRERAAHGGPDDGLRAEVPRHDNYAMGMHPKGRGGKKTG